MISILIPTYNYDASQLVKEINVQCLNLKIDFEILVYNDGGTEFETENTKINLLKNCHYSSGIKNIGRTQSRDLLAKKALYNWLLFLDADVLPTQTNFIKNYISAINNHHSVIVGGCKYKPESLNSNTTLRYKYGVERESKNAMIRNEKPYSNILSANILIRKDIFLQSNFMNEKKYYGMDIFFSYQLMIQRNTVFHIENPVFHMGLESNEAFFEKCLMSVKSRKETLIDKPRIEEINSLIRYYKFIKANRLITITNLFFKITKPLLKKLIFSKNPNLISLDLYRLGYLCTLK